MGSAGWRYAHTHTQMHNRWSSDQARSGPPVPGRGQVSRVWMGCGADAGSTACGISPTHGERWGKMPQAKPAPPAASMQGSRDTGVSGEGTASPATAGDLPPPPRPKAQAGLPKPRSSCPHECGRGMRVPQHTQCPSHRPLHPLGLPKRC